MSHFDVDHDYFNEEPTALFGYSTTSFQEPLPLSECWKLGEIDDSPAVILVQNEICIDDLAFNFNYVNQNPPILCNITKTPKEKSPLSEGDHLGTNPKMIEPSLLLPRNINTPDISGLPKFDKATTHGVIVKSDTMKLHGLEGQIWKIYNQLVHKQRAIDLGTYSKRGPGRNRKNQNMTSDELFELIKAYFRCRLKKIWKNEKCHIRKDIMLTALFRVIKKLPYYLITKWSTMNLYKRKEVSQYVQAFWEAAWSFNSAQGKGYKEDQEIIRDLVEFSVVYFPYEKCRMLIKALKFNPKFLDVQQHILMNRETTTKKNVIGWSSNSKIFWSLVQIWKEVLEENLFAKSGMAKELRNMTKEFLQAS